MLITLLIMSAMSIYWIVINLFKNIALRRSADRVVGTFWETTNAQDAIRYMEEQQRREPFSKIALDAAQAAAHHQRHEGSRLVESLNRSEFVDRALRQAVTRESMRLESGLTVLATVGSTAPFVGLLGTVWGIYGALIRIGATGQASIDAVAGPVGEALIMTAIGLFTAIPAVLGYNFFVRLNRVTYNKFDTFAHDLHDFFATGARVGEAAGQALSRHTTESGPMAFSTGNQSGAPMSEINVTPLVDVMLVLLIIFMITAPLMSHKIKVELPKANLDQRPDKVPPAPPVTVTVKEDGTLYWNDAPVTHDQLESQLSVAAQATPQPEVNIRGDPTTKYRIVADVVNTAQLQGIAKVGFVATKERH